MEKGRVMEGVQSEELTQWQKQSNQERIGGINRRKSGFLPEAPSQLTLEARNQDQARRE